MDSQKVSYKYVQAGNRVIAISTYAGKTVRGVAKCDPRDNFDIEAGKKLAAARCNQKVLAKRFARSQKKVAEAERVLAEAQRFYDRMKAYYADSTKKLNEATHEVEAIEKSF